VHITEDRLEQVEGFFDRHGGKAILLGRFVGLVRAVAPFLAGSSGMPLRRFLPYDVIGAGLWGASFVLLGYVFWQSFSQLVDYAKKGALALGAVIVLVVAIVAAVRWLRDEGNRARARAWLEGQAERPALRPVAGVLRPLLRRSRRPARFVWNRVTPGDLGLELTTLLAVASVGGFIFVWDLVGVEQRGLLAGDSAFLRMADRLNFDAGVTAAKAISTLGSLTAAILLVAASGALLVWRRERASALVLVTGLLLTWAGVHVTKTAVDRPRPSRPLIEVEDPSYPSGHAAYAVTWVAVAVALSRALPNVASRFAFVVVAIVIAAAVGLSRVYLRAHYISDVVGGWSMASAVYALCAVTMLVIVYVRNNALARA
jgi:membrane-associated phospholipid phosphatase